MDRQALVTKLTEYIAKPVTITSVVSGQTVGGTGVLKDILIDSDQNGCVKVEFQDGRMFGVQESSVTIARASKEDAETAVEEGEGLNADEGDGVETDEAKADRKAKEKGHPGTRTAHLESDEKTPSKKVKVKKVK